MKYFESAIINCPESKEDAFMAMLSDMIYSGNKNEIEYVMLFIKEKYHLLVGQKLIAYLVVLINYRASNRHVWDETYDEIILLLKNAIRDNNRESDEIVHKMLFVLSISERPYDLIQCINILTYHTNKDNPNIYHIIFTIVKIKNRFNDVLLFSEMKDKLNNYIKSEQYKSLNDELKQSIINLIAEDTIYIQQSKDDEKLLLTKPITANCELLEPCVPNKSIIKYKIALLAIFFFVSLYALLYLSVTYAKGDNLFQKLTEAWRLIPLAIMLTALLALIVLIDYKKYLPKWLIKILKIE